MERLDRVCSANRTSSNGNAEIRNRFKKWVRLGRLESAPESGLHNYYCKGCRRWDSRPYVWCSSCSGWLRRRWIRIGGALLVVTILNLLLLHRILEKRNDPVPPQPYTIVSAQTR